MSGTTTIGYNGAKTTYTAVTARQYYIVAYGAQGGSNNSSAGGLGAEISGTFTLTAGEVLTVGAGGSGGSGASAKAPAGGGGGTFVVDPGGTPLVIAGGGGGEYTPSPTRPVSKPRCPRR